MSEIDAKLIAALEDRYAIQGELGEGGMATVYLADDLKHDRKVALKVLKPELAAVIGGERFISEIKTTAALQHPHILPLFDSGEADGFLYYVMPFVDGESLRDHLDREKQMDVDEAVKMAEAVASALQYAHDNDVIHRDIKPENILLHASQPVVADFGIALAISAAGGGRLTETGLSLGTPHYMSPEQATADRDLTARSDVYALACVLYEMLAGDPPHTGPTAQSILMRILTEDPRPIGEIRHAVPRHLAAVLDKALEKLPADRFKSAEEFKRALTDDGFTYERKTRAQVSPLPPPPPQPTGPSWGADFRTRVLVGTNLLFLLGMGWALTRSGPSGVSTDALPLHRYAIDEPGAGNGAHAVSVAGDVVYALAGAEGSGLGLVRAGSLEPEVIPGTEEAENPAFSPDGEWIAFNVANGDLKKVQVGGGPVITVVRSGDPMGEPFNPHWGDNGMIAFSGQDGIYLVPEVGGEPERVVEGPPPGIFNPHLLPGGRALLYSTGGFTATRTALLNLESGDTATVVPEGGHPLWSTTGHLLTAHESGAVFATPFDLDRLEVTGPSVPVLESVQTFGAGFVANVSLSPNGSFAYVTGSAVAAGALFTFNWRDRDGNVTRIPLDPVDHEDARVSPDGRYIAYVANDDVFVYDTELGTNAPLTFEGEGHHNPAWSPDGTQVVFSSIRGDSEGIDLYIKDVDGRSPAERLGGTEWGDYPGVWLADGTIVFYTVGNPDRGNDIYRMPADGSGEAEPILQADWGELVPSVSPDGQWIAYRSNEDGNYQVYVRTWPDLAGQWIVSDPTAGAVGNTTPIWSPDGSSIIYGQFGNIVEATIGTEPSFHVLSRENLSSIYVGQPEDIHPDGERLLVLTQGDVGQGGAEQATPTLVVVSNWFTELRARLGEGGG